MDEKRDHEQDAEDAQRAIDDPAIKRVFDRLEKGFVDIALELQYDELGAWHDTMSECGRMLRVVRSLRRELNMTVQREKLKIDAERLVAKTTSEGTIH